MSRDWSEYPDQSHHNRTESTKGNKKLNLNALGNHATASTMTKITESLLARLSTSDWQTSSGWINLKLRTHRTRSRTLGDEATTLREKSERDWADRWTHAPLAALVLETPSESGTNAQLVTYRWSREKRGTGRAYVHMHPHTRGRSLDEKLYIPRGKVDSV